MLFRSWYYLFFIATIRNKSFLIQHPNHPIPHIVSPPRKTTAYSIPPTPSMQDHLHENYPLPPPTRCWQDAAHLLEEFDTTYPSFRPIVLDGDVIRPPLQQGMMIYHQGQLIFIQQEHSRWPTRNNYIITTTFRITTKNPSFYSSPSTRSTRLVYMTKTPSLHLTEPSSSPSSSVMSSI